MKRRNISKEKNHSRNLDSKSVWEHIKSILLWLGSISPMISISSTITSFTPNSAVKVSSESSNNEGGTNEYADEWDKASDDDKTVASDIALELGKHSIHGEADLSRPTTLVNDDSHIVTYKITLSKSINATPAASYQTEDEDIKSPVTYTANINLNTLKLKKTIKSLGIEAGNMDITYYVSDSHLHTSVTFTILQFKTPTNKIIKLNQKDAIYLNFDCEDNNTNFPNQNINLQIKPKIILTAINSSTLYLLDYILQVRQDIDKNGSIMFIEHREQS